MTQLKTDWLRIATEGQTFRNVPIERQWLVDIAETYQVETYGARIWPDHRRWYGAWGDVLAVKTEEQDGKLRLFAKLSPNAQLISANEQDQKVFTSIEVDPNFAQSGKAYLTGLGVTDEPASLGTDRLKFSTKERYKTHQYGAPEQLVISYSTDDEIDKEEITSPENQQALFSVLGKFFKSFTTNQAPAPTEEDPMDAAQFKQITDKIDGIGEKVTELEGKVESFSKKPVAAKPEVKQEGEESTPLGVTGEQFSTLLEKVSGIADKTDKLTNDFAALKLEVPGQEPNSAGLNEPESCTV